MKAKSVAAIRTLLAVVIFSAVAFAATKDVSAVARAKTSTKSESSESKTNEEAVTDSKDLEADETQDADSESSDSSKKTTTSSGSSKKTTTSSGSSKKTTASSSADSDGYKVLLTDKQRTNKFKSKTNPKMGATPITLPRPASAGFSYADFGRYNDYNSDNHLGGTPIYLLGTVMDVQPVKEGDTDYKVAVMVNDCDGYQWYIRVNCSKDKYGLMKNEILGKAGYIYGTYAGYSGVTNRPMMDMMIMIETPGNAVNMSLYR